MRLAATPDRVSLRNILLPIDFSSRSETILAYGAALARRYDCTLYTVTVVPEEITDYVEPPDPFFLRHSAEKKMASLANPALLQGVKHRELVKEGSVRETLAELIDRLEIDLVVLGTHGRGGMKKMVLGSAAEELVNSALCPVLTFGPQVPTGVPPQGKLQGILYATDLLRASGRALAFALWLAERDGARLTLVHVLKIPNGVQHADSQSEIELTKKRLAELLRPEVLSVDTECITEIGAPGERILKIAESQGADLIVMGPHHTAHARAATHLPWDTTHKVLSHARCPVLTVRD